MKLISFSHANRESWGTYASDGGVIDLGAEFINSLPTLKDYIGSDTKNKNRVNDYLRTGFGGGGCLLYTSDAADE